MLTPGLYVLQANTAVCALLGRDADELAGRSIREFVDAGDPEQDAGLIVPGPGDFDQTRFVRRYVRPDGSVVDALVTTVLVEPGDCEPYFFAQLQDVTEQLRSERRKATLAQLGRRAFEYADAASLMGEAIVVARDLLGTANCIVNRRMTDGEIRNLAVVGEVIERSIAAGQPSQSAYTLLCGEPVVSNDLLSEGRFSAPETVVRAGLRRGLSVPVPQRSGAQSVVLAQRHLSDPEFTPGETQFLSAIAYMIGAALDRDATEELLRRRALEDPLVRAAVDLGQALGVKMIAEGIERPHQLAVLRELGCHVGQGFLFAQPLPALDALRLVHQPARLTVPKTDQAA